MLKFIKFALCRGFSNKIANIELATTLANHSVPSKEMVNYMFKGVNLKYNPHDIEKTLLNFNKCPSKKEFHQECKNSLIYLIEKSDPLAFNNIKFLKCNIDQPLSFLGSSNFVLNAAPEKLIECLSSVIKSKDLTLYKRPEIINSIHHLIKTDIIAKLSPSHVNSIIWILAKMSIDDITLWLLSLKAFALKANDYDCRCLSNIATNIYKGSKIFKSSFNFSEIMYSLEKTIIARFHVEYPDPQSLAMICVAYSKQQMGSVEFLRELEHYIVSSLNQFKMQEIANILYSYSKLENANLNFFKDIIPFLYDKFPKFKPMEFCQLIYAIDKAKICNYELYEKVLYYFVEKCQFCNAEDIAEIYYFTMKNYREHKYFRKYAEYVDTCIRKLYKTFTPNQIIKIYSFPNSRIESITNIAKLRLLSQANILLHQRSFNSREGMTYLDLLNEIRQKSQEEEDIILKLGSYIDKKKYLTSN